MRAVPFLVSETSSWLGYCFRRHGWGECSHGLKACRLPPAGKPIRHDKKSDKSFAHFRLFFIANSLAHFNAQNDRVLQSVYNQRIVVGSVWRHSFSRRFCLRRLSRHRAIIIFSSRDCYLFSLRQGLFRTSKWRFRLENQDETRGKTADSGAGGVSFPSRLQIFQSPVFVILS